MKKSALRFIGEDGSMALSQGRVYDVTLFTSGKFFWVRWTPHQPWPTSGEPQRACPYATLQAFANNWSLP